MNKSESIKNIAIALCKFNTEVTHISKDANNPFFKSQYVTLDKLIEETRGLMAKHGLSVMQFPKTVEGNGIGIQSLLLHESGEYIEGEAIFMTPVKNDPQAAGSVISYLRRYSYQAILNLNCGEDDDGNRATYGNEQPKPQQNRNPQAQQNRPNTNNQIISEAQAKRLFAISKSKGLNTEQLKELVFKHSKKNSSKELVKAEYDMICQELESM